jgi:hypothetical protein
MVSVTTAAIIRPGGKGAKGLLTKLMFMLFNNIFTERPKLWSSVYENTEGATFKNKFNSRY